MRWFNIVLKRFSLWMKSHSVTIQVKATEKYFLVILFMPVEGGSLTFESGDEIFNCDNSNESY